MDAWTLFFLVFHFNDANSLCVSIVPGGDIREEKKKSGVLCPQSQGRDFNWSRVYRHVRTRALIECRDGFLYIGTIGYVGVKDVYNTGADIFSAVLMRFDAGCRSLRGFRFGFLPPIERRAKIYTSKSNVSEISSRWRGAFNDADSEKYPLTLFPSGENSTLTQIHKNRGLAQSRKTKFQYSRFPRLQQQHIFAFQLVGGREEKKVCRYPKRYKPRATRYKYYIFLYLAALE